MASKISTQRAEDFAQCKKFVQEMKKLEPKFDSNTNDTMLQIIAFEGEDEEGKPTLLPPRVIIQIRHSKGYMVQIKFKGRELRSKSIDFIRDKAAEIMTRSINRARQLKHHVETGAAKVVYNSIRPLFREGEIGDQQAKIVNIEGFNE